MDQSVKSISRAELEAQSAIFAFEGKHRFLSNFGDGGAEMYGIFFPTVEHAFAAAKLDPNGGVFTRAEVLAEMKRIAALPSPGEAKRAGRRRNWDGTQPDEERKGVLRPFLRPDWEEVKLDLITELVRRKFADPVLASALLATGDVPLWEGNTWGDRIWGVVEKDGAFAGKNLLGQILMLIRSELRAAKSA
jgi:ribA/ribD-fused uncharacterized protein